MTANILFAYNHKSSTMTYDEKYDQMLHFVSHFARIANTYSETSELYREFLSIVQALVYCEQAVLYHYHENTTLLSPVAYWSQATGVVNVQPAQAIADKTPRSVSDSVNSRYETATVDVASLLFTHVDLDTIPPLVASAALHRHIFLHCSTPSDQQEPAAEMAIPLQAQKTPVGVLLLKRSATFSGKDAQLLREICSIAAMSWYMITCKALINQRKKEQEPIERRQSQFLSLLTHELRSPLNSIHGYLDLVLMGAGGDLNAQQHEFVQRARVASQNLYASLEDLLCIARADAGQSRLHHTVLSLAAIIDDVIEEVALTAADHGIELSVEVEPQLPDLYADTTRLQQIIRNLINNAIRFTPEGGTVKIMACIEEASLLASTRSSSSYEDVNAIACLRVIDTGIGIAPAFHQRIFERFYRVLDKNAHRSGGQGLGLSVVKHLVELHGGTVSVESALGQGSTFTCLIPGLLSS